MVAKFLQSEVSLDGMLRQLDISRFLSWWKQGLLACLPDAIARHLVSSPKRTLIEIRGDEVVVLEEENNNLEELERYPLAAVTKGAVLSNVGKGTANPLVLRLPASIALTKKLVLPLAAEANLRQVVGFEMDRLTPFSVAKVYYAIQVLQRDTRAKRLHIRFTAVPRPHIDDLLKPLAGAGLSPDKVDVAGSDPEINLLPPNQRPRKGQLAQRSREGLLILFIVLLVALGMLPLWQQQRLITDNLMPKVEVAEQQAEEILDLRNELENSLESSRFLVQKRKETPLMVDIMRELTRILPDGTWVERLEIKGNEIQVRGQSSQASALLALVEASELFHNATFGSPITADRRTGQDRFYLSAQVSQQS
jgi:general secretion pathway protein L